MLFHPLIAKLGKGTLTAFWGSGGANIPPEQNNAVTEIAAFLRRQDSTQLLFHLFRVCTGA